MSVSVTNSGGTISIDDGNSVLYPQKNKVSVGTVTDPVNGASVFIRYDEDHYVQYPATQFSAPTGTAAAIAATIAGYLDSGAGNVSGSGTTNYIPKWTAGTTLGNSLLYDNGTSVLMGGTTAIASAQFAMTSTTQGFLMPSMTTVQKNAIGTPATGLLLFDTTLGLFSYYTGAAWAQLDTGTNDYTQGGNAFAATGTLGLTDANTLNIITNNITRIGITSGGNISMTQSVATSGSPTAFTVTSAAHTTIASATEDIGVNFNFSATKQWTSGTINVQREFLIQAPTYAMTSAATIATAATLAISAAPIAGTNATITNSLALWVQSGETRLVGSGSGNTTYALRTYNVTPTEMFSVRNDGKLIGGTTAWTFLGNNCGLSATGNFNTGFGTSCATSLSTGTSNSAFGYQSLYTNSTGASNAAFGTGALRLATNSFNSAFGDEAGAVISTGQYNAVFGWLSGGAFTTSSFNSSFGASSMRNTTGGSNCAFGTSALEGNTTGASNSAFGVLAGGANNGDGNVFIGYYAGQNQTGVSNALFVDNQDRGSAAADLTNSLIYGVFNATVASQTLTVNGALGINQVPTATFGITQLVATSGSPTAFSLISAAHTTLATTVEDIGVNYNLSATKQWATGAIATQREFLIQAPTYGFVAASTVTDAATLAITGAPIAGTNATLTRSMALWVQAGALRFDGDFRFGAATNIDTTAGDGATINAIRGRFRKDTTGSTFTLTNSFITANSIIILQYASDPGITGFDNICVAGAGSAVITFTTSGVPAAPTDNTDMNFLVIN